MIPALPSNCCIKPFFEPLPLLGFFSFLTAFEIFLIYSLPVLWRTDIMISWSSLVGEQVLYCFSQTISVTYTRRKTVIWLLKEIFIHVRIIHSYECLYEFKKAFSVEQNQIAGIDESNHYSRRNYYKDPPNPLIWAMHIKPFNLT